MTLERSIGFALLVCAAYASCEAFLIWGKLTRAHAASGDHGYKQLTCAIGMAFVLWLCVIARFHMR